MLREWKEMGTDAVPISVNVSRIDLYHDCLLYTSNLPLSTVLSGYHRALKKMKSYLEEGVRRQ